MIVDEETPSFQECEYAILMSENQTPRLKRIRCLINKQADSVIDFDFA